MLRRLTDDPKHAAELETLRRLRDEAAALESHAERIAAELRLPPEQRTASAVALALAEPVAGNAPGLRAELDRTRARLDLLGRAIAEQVATVDASRRRASYRAAAEHWPAVQRAAAKVASAIDAMRKAADELDRTKAELAAAGFDPDALPVWRPDRGEVGERLARWFDSTVADARAHGLAGTGSSKAA